MMFNPYNKRNTKITPSQREIMLTFMEAHPDLTRNKTTVQERNNLWETLAAQLNTYSMGPAKDAERWKKSWVDWKCLVKSKIARGNNNCSNNGGEYLSQLEMRLLQLVDWKGVQEGDIPTTSPEPETDEVEQKCTFEVTYVSSRSLRKQCKFEVTYVGPCTEINKVFPNSVVTASDSLSRLEDDFEEASEEPVIEASTQTTTPHKLRRWSNLPVYQRTRRLYRSLARIPRLPFRKASSQSSSAQLPRAEASNEGTRVALERIASAQERIASAEERKVTAQERMAAAEERKATAQERVAGAEERKATSLEGMLSLVTEFVKR